MKQKKKGRMMQKLREWDGHSVLSQKEFAVLKTIEAKQHRVKITALKDQRLSVHKSPPQAVVFVAKQV